MCFVGIAMYHFPIMSLSMERKYCFIPIASECEQHCALQFCTLSSFVSETTVADQIFSPLRRHNKNNHFVSNVG